MNEEFGRDVEQGLSASPKKLSSKYFYDEIGDQIFVNIMNMPEYYLTNCEFEILSDQAESIISKMIKSSEEFDLYELGAGDGTKTIQLLRAMSDLNFTYKPIDISPFAIDNLEKRLKDELPWLKVKGAQGEYFQILNSLESKKNKVILFLGSNIGNLLDDQSKDFIEKLSQVMNKRDKLLLGVDRKKAKSIILPAYNDAQGYSRDFNLNLLSRINRELGANFDINQFEHCPHYDENEGIAYSYLKSLCKQEVRIDSISKTFSFAKDEKVHTEISRKYDDSVIERITKDSGLRVLEVFSDRKNYFSDYLLEKE